MSDAATQDRPEPLVLERKPGRGLELELVLTGLGPAGLGRAALSVEIGPQRLQRTSRATTSS